MKKDIMNWPTLKEIERDLFKVLQHTFADVLSKVLEDLDQQITATRDKGRFRYKDKRPLTLDTLFGLFPSREITIKTEKLASTFIFWIAILRLTDPRELVPQLNHLRWNWPCQAVPIAMHLPP